MDRLTDKLSDAEVASGLGLEIALIWSNEDLNVCDYTVHMGRLVKK